jgi:uncharacterized protein
MNVVNISDPKLEPHRDPPNQGSILEVCIYIALCCLISWPLWFMTSRMPGLTLHVGLLYKMRTIPLVPVLFTLGNMGPGISAITTLLASRSRKSHLHALWKRIAAPRGPWGWYVFALLIVPLVDAVSVVFYIANGGKIIAPISLTVWLHHFIVYLPFIPLSAEIGMRGFLLPRLISRTNNFIASILVGAASALWGSPFYGVLSMSSTRQQWVEFLYFASISIALSVVFTCVYLGTKQSLIPVIALHSSVLASGTMLMHILPSGERLPYRVSWLAWWVVALLVYSLWGDPGSNRRQLCALPSSPDPPGDNSR